MKTFCLFAACLVFANVALADDSANYRRAQVAVDEALLDLYGGRLDSAQWKQTSGAVAQWVNGADQSAKAAPVEKRAALLGAWNGSFQHHLASRMLAAIETGDIAAARLWRAEIKMPRYGDANQGVLLLQNPKDSQRTELQRALAREYIIWQTTLAREKSDTLLRAVERGHFNPDFIQARAAEIEALSRFPESILVAADADKQKAGTLDSSIIDGIAASAAPGAALASWIGEIKAALPNLLNEEEVIRRERLLVKLLRLVPIEYKAGVRDGVVIIPIEYREAQTFTLQADQIVDELVAPWSATKAGALAASEPLLREKLRALDREIKKLGDPREVERLASETTKLLETDFDVTLRKQGKASDVIAETVLEVRTLLTGSLAAAEAGRHVEAGKLRLEAYTTFDLEIEARVLPRDPKLALDVEKRFLDGDREQIGIKAALDARLRGPELEKAYAHAIKGMEDCAAILTVGLSPATTVFTAFTVTMREGLEAVVILAALLAGLRGAENRRTRQCIGAGAWCAVGASILLFWGAQTVIASLSRFGEKLEAIVSLIAVAILLMVTNWVFHKYYWTGWNAKLRGLSKSVDRHGKQRSALWLGTAMVGVGFVTIFREGFETVLFLQSLILEGGLRAVMTGLALGLAAIAIVGLLVFRIGSKLPYRKMLVFTGVLVVSVLVTFLGSTVRLFQTVGWMPIHPITWLDIPSWAGIWLGLYPSLEGLLIPLAGLVYVAAAWAWVKWANRGGVEAAKAIAPNPATVH